MDRTPQPTVAKSSLAEQVETAKKEWESWTKEKQESVRLEGGDAAAPQAVWKPAVDVPFNRPSKTFAYATKTVAEELMAAFQPAAPKSSLTDDQAWEIYQKATNSVMHTGGRAFAIALTKEIGKTAVAAERAQRHQIAQKAGR